MGNRNKIILIIAVTIMATCFYVAWNHHRKITPTQNSNPTQFITVSGHLDKGLYLKIGASYATDQNICWHYSNYEEGLKQPNFYHFVYTPTVDSNNNYSVKIPLDALQPGNCSWGIGGLYSIMSDNKDFNHTNENFLVHFYDHAKPSKNPSFHLLCYISSKGNGVFCRFPRVIATNFNPFNLYSGTSNIQINFINEEK